MSEQVLLHETVIGGRVGRIEADVFVQVESGHTAEVETVGGVHPSQFLIQIAGGAARRQSQHRVRLFANLSGNQPCRNLAGFLRSR